MPKVYMPTNNTISLPFFLKFLVKEGLVDIQVPMPGTPSAYDKGRSEKPNFINIVFLNNDIILKEVCNRLFKLHQYTEEDFSEGGNIIAISNFTKLRRTLKSLFGKEKDQNEQIAILKNEYLKKINLEISNVRKDERTKKLLEVYCVNYDVVLASGDDMLAIGQKYLEFRRQVENAEVIYRYDTEKLKQQEREQKSQDELTDDDNPRRSSSSGNHPEPAEILSSDNEAQSPLSSSPPPPYNAMSSHALPLPQPSTILGSITLYDSQNDNKSDFATATTASMPSTMVNSYDRDRRSQDDGDEEGFVKTESDSTPPNHARAINNVVIPFSTTDSQPEGDREGARKTTTYDEAGRERFVDIDDASVTVSIKKKKKKIKKITEDETEPDPRGVFTSELKNHIAACAKAPIIIPDEKPTDSSLQCSLTGKACRIPVFINNKLHDLRTLSTYIPGFGKVDFFDDPSTLEKVYKNEIVPAPEIFVRTIAYFKEKKFFDEFVEKHKDAYQARFWLVRRSKFMKLHEASKLNNFTDLLHFLIRYPTSRSAKIFAEMEATPDNPWAAYLKNYMAGYNRSGFFRSNSLKKLQSNEIKSIEDAQTYAAANPNSRTAKVISIK